LSVTIRDIAPGDEARWRDLWKGYCEFYETEMAGSVTDETWRRLLDAKEEGMFSLVACGGEGAVIGFTNCVLHPITWSETPVCYLEDLFVDPGDRNSGAGRALIEAVLEIGRAKGWHRVYWRTKNDNATARALYDKVSDLTDWVVYEVPL
jgi:GNAT superfamily N-acetyltransferase